MSVIMVVIGIIFLLLVSFMAGFYLSDFMLILEDKKQIRCKQRFDWYRSMGLYESAALTELALAKKYSMPYKL